MIKLLPLASLCEWVFGINGKSQVAYGEATALGGCAYLKRLIIRKSTIPLFSPEQNLKLANPKAKI